MFMLFTCSPTAPANFPCASGDFEITEQQKLAETSEKDLSIKIVIQC